MVDTRLPMALAKVIIAAAWVDGEINNTEMEAMRDVIFRMPKLTAQQWAEIDIYLSSPVEKAERDRLVDELKAQIKSSEDREFVKTALRGMLANNENNDEEQRKVIESIISEVKSTSNIFSVLGNLISSELQLQGNASAPNREELLEEFFNNRIYYEIRRRLELTNQDVHLSDDEMRKLGYIGALLAHVSMVDQELDDNELKVMMKTIMRTWALNENQASFVITIATSEKSENYDLVRTARSLFDMCTYDELLGLLEVMFEIALADDRLKDEEVNKIYVIARALLISNQDYKKIRKKYLSER